MAVAYRSSTSTNTGASAAGSIVLSMPTGVQVNDSLLATVGVDGGTGATITAPAGWTLLRSATQSTNTRTSTYWRLADGYETPTYTWTFDTNRMASGAMLAYSGCHPFAPPSSTSVSTASASTTIAGAGTNSSYTGLAVMILVTRNTTAASTMTVGASYTERVDTCTTASAFIGLQVEDVAKGFAMGGTTSSSSTCSQSSTGNSTSLFLEDARPTFASLAEDEFAVGSSSALISGISAITFQTNYPNELVLAFVNINKDVQTVSSMTWGSLTWVLVARANTNAGSTEIWRTFAPTPIASSTVTATFSNPATSSNILVVGIVGADLTGTFGSGAIGATATGTSTTAAPTIDVVTTRNNSWVWVSGQEAGVNGSQTAGANQTLLRAQNDTTNVALAMTWRQNAITAVSGTTVTMNATAPSTASFNIAAVEILPAIRKNLGTAGVG